jgi:hypothetical protein
MFSVLNEINNNSHYRTTSVIFASIGSAAIIYVLVGVTGYLSFGSKVSGNIIGMCMYSRFHPFSHVSRELRLTKHRFTLDSLYDWKGGYRSSCHVLLSVTGSPLQSVG